MNTHPIVRPLINMNGSDPKALVRDWQEVAIKTGELMAAIANLRPHGRDYITLAYADQYDNDRDAHHEVMQKLAALQRQAFDTALYIQDQID